MNKIKEILEANKAMGEYNDIAKEIDTMDAKSLFTSKTFWLNIGGFLLTISGILPHKWAPYVLVAANIINRFATNQPIYLFSPDSLKKGN